MFITDHIKYKLLLNILLLPLSFSSEPNKSLSTCIFHILNMYPLPPSIQPPPCRSRHLSSPGDIYPFSHNYHHLCRPLPLVLGNWGKCWHWFSSIHWQNNLLLVAVTRQWRPRGSPTRTPPAADVLLFWPRPRTEPSPVPSIYQKPTPALLREGIRGFCGLVQIIRFNQVRRVLETCLVKDEAQIDGDMIGQNRQVITNPGLMEGKSG